MKDKEQKKWHEERWGENEEPGETPTERPHCDNDSLKNQDKEQIIIDGVDVSRCIDFNKRDKVSCYHILYDKCNENPNCYFKQLACKTQECEQKDKELLSNEKIINKLMKEVDELRQECEELKKRATIAEDNFACEVQARLYHQNEWLKFSKECEELKNIIAYPKYRNEIAIKELENKTKKELIEEIVHCHQIGESTVHCVYAPLREENNRYRKALEEIVRELKEDIYCESQECGCDDYKECLRCTKNIILDIINKAKGNNNEVNKD